MRSSITLSQIEAAYRAALEVSRRTLSRSEAIEYLHKEYGLNQASASDFITDFECMISGKVYHRTMSAEATRFFLDQILRDFGPESLQKATQSVSHHIQYYENLRNVTLHRLRGVLASFQMANNRIPSLKELEEQFLAAVAKAQKDSPDGRTQRLLSARRIPTKRLVISEVFDRNPDVVAEVLFRSGGICEKCKSAAPFRRESSGEPYLEVHHRIPLANGGDDTIENACALCPNCHRELHYGRRDT